MALPSFGSFSSPTAAVAASSTTLSQDDPNRKVRKQYTISKSRESWTEPEHDKFMEAIQLIKINILTPVKFGPKSPGMASPSHLNWRSPTGSPYSSSHQTPLSYHQTATTRSPLSYHQTATTRSPLSPYIQSPSFSPSSGNSVANSTNGIARPQCGSPSTYQVSRKSYEKLRKPGS